MTLYAVTWLAATWACPFWLPAPAARRLPAVRALACAETRALEQKVTSYGPEADRAARAAAEAGQPVLVTELRGARARSRAVRMVVQIEP